MTKNSKFIAQEKNPLLNPVDYFNFYGDFTKIFDNHKNCNVKSPTEVCLLDPKNLDSADINKPTFVLKDGFVHTIKNNQYDIAEGSIISKFMLLTAVKFKGDYSAAISYVSFSIMKTDIPYIRVKCDYFKLTKEQDRWNTTNYKLTSWKKDEITQDHTKQIYPLIPKFDDFTLIPNNKEFIPVKSNCYNLYNRFSHNPYSEDVSHTEIPHSLSIIEHIFGEQAELGLKYLKIIYENPTQILPILSLVSTERETGKTTFLNWMTTIFGQNAVLISPQSLSSNFNASYATKNIIMIDETVIEKSTSVEKLKSLATAKTIDVSEKFVQQYSIPFFGKIIMCTNKEKDFMRIDEEEIRFWIRKIKPISKKNTHIEDDLVSEIPKFLKYLIQLPEIDFTKSRMVFTQDEIKTSHLEIIKEESKSGLRKDIEIMFEDIFNTDPTLKEFYVTAIDVKNRWFAHNNQISLNYIHKVLRDEMKLNAEKKVTRYHPFGELKIQTLVGRPYLIVNQNFEEKSQLKIDNDPPF